MKIAILGAESTGKSHLAGALADTLRRQGNNVVLVGEYLREWCDTHGRTPRADEQNHVAREQARRVEAAIALSADSTVIADTTPLMTAVYSELLFNDTSLYDFAATHQRTYDITLVTGLDLPWVADGLQRDGPHSREATDSLLRAALDRASLGYHVVYGTGAARLANALNCLNTIILVANYSYRTLEKRQLLPEKPKMKAWTWPCEKCSDPDCEHRLFTRLSR